MVGGRVRAADWRRGDDYEYLRGVERPMFAWEWLRRTRRYRELWRETRGLDQARRASAAHQVGLVELLPPALSAAEAVPVWRAERDPRVIAAAAASGPEMAPEDRLDIRSFADLAMLALDDEDAEHWRFGTAARSVRLDVTQGTLLGGPTALRFELAGLARLRPKLAPLDLLIRLAAPSVPSLAPPRDPRAARWITELRTADALAAGAHQQAIARALFGAAVPVGGWRREGESYRLRVQRLVRAAQARLLQPLAESWFR